MKCIIILERKKKKRNQNHIFAYLFLGFIIFENNFIDVKKRTIIISICLLSLFLENSVFALSYKDSFVLEVRTQQNTQANIDQAKLLYKYIRDYKKGISDFEQKYSIEDSFVLDAYKKELDSMMQALKKTQTLYIEKSDAENIRQSVVDGLRPLNKLIKSSLEKEKEKYEKKLIIAQSFYVRI